MTTKQNITSNSFIEELEKESGITLSPTSIFLLIIFTIFGFVVAVNYGYGIWFVCLFVMMALVAILIGVLINAGSNSNLQIGPMTLILSIAILCFYVFVGLYITADIKETVGYMLSWTIYTCLCLTVLNMALITIYWSVIRKKTGSIGIRGIQGDRGKQGEQGQCNLDSANYNYINQILTHINTIYKQKTNDTTKTLLNSSLRPINSYLDSKIYSMLTSHQLKTLIYASAEMNLSTENILGYIKTIWTQWMDLLFIAGGEQWFQNEKGNETGPWLDNQNNPFDEIRKYDIYYWGMGRLFRPLKISTCQSSALRSNPNLPKSGQTYSPKLSIINTNDYGVVSTDKGSGGTSDISWWRAKKVTMGNKEYHPIGDIPMAGDKDQVYYGVYKKGKTIIDKLEYDVSKNSLENTGVITSNGPDMQTILVSGDVQYPSSFEKIWQNNDDFKNALYRPVCPDNYTSMGDIVMPNWDGSYSNNTISNVYINQNSAKTLPVCLPSDCLVPIYSNITVLWQANKGANVINSLNTWTNVVDQGSLDDYGYNLMRGNNGVFYKIKESCIARDNNTINKTKELEDSTKEIGIGWYGTPSPTDSKYSIFTFLNLVPEGIITNESKNKSFYVIHYGGEDANKFIILEYNNVTDKFDNALQITDNNSIIIRELSRNDIKQQWSIQFINGTNKNYFNMKSVYNNRLLQMSDTTTIVKLDTTNSENENTKFKFTTATGVSSKILN